MAVVQSVQCTRPATVTSWKQNLKKVLCIGIISTFWLNTRRQRELCLFVIKKIKYDI